MKLANHGWIKRIVTNYCNYILTLERGDACRRNSMQMQFGICDTNIHFVMGSCTISWARLSMLTLLEVLINYSLLLLSKRPK